MTAPGGTRVGPKIVASTATTKNAAAQVKGVFGRELAIFPPPVLDVADTFFSTQVPVTPENPGRRYLDLRARRPAQVRGDPGRRDPAAGRADPVRRARRGGRPVHDPRRLLQRDAELAGMRRYLDDDVATRVRRHGRLKDMSDRLTGMRMLEIAELTSRISSPDISVALKRLEVGFDTEYDTSARKRAIGAEWKAVLDARKANKSVEPHEIAKNWRERGDSAVDVVLATSMLQVGVDVSRFGLMVVTGQPKNTAEYIQASSRVGRDAKRPGLVVTLYNWTRPRDLAHYEDFEHYHSTFYRQVEALSVTPFTRRSLDRTTAGTVVAALRNVVEEHSHNPDAGTVPLDGPIVKAVLDRLLARAQYIGGHRGRDYLQQRLARFTDVWKKWQGAEDQALGYEQTKGGTERCAGCCTAPATAPGVTRPSRCPCARRRTRSTCSSPATCPHRTSRPRTGRSARRPPTPIRNPKATRWVTARFEGGPTVKFRRRVGAVRPSHLMFTSGIGSLVDLPNFSVLVRGTDDWTYFPSKPETVDERRLLAAVQRVDGLQDVTTLQKAPWMDGTDADPDGEASRVGVPVDPFPTWLRCTACNELALFTTSVFRFVNDIPSRPHDAKFVHGCRRSGKPPSPSRHVSCWPARTDISTTFPTFSSCTRAPAAPSSGCRRWRCTTAARTSARTSRCGAACGAARNMREALGKLGEKNLPACRGRHAHLRVFSDEDCDQKPKTLVVGRPTSGSAARSRRSPCRGRDRTSWRRSWRSTGTTSPA
ncbi:helicase-related protein [Pseudonocardia benzenivorans]